MTDLRDLPVTTLAGEKTTFGALTDGRAALVVNVASRCGLTPQYAGLEKLHEELAGRGFTVIGFPSNQFGRQEPGTAEEIAAFCSTTYGVTFPLSAKIEVNGEGRDPVYAELTQAADAEGRSGDITWNFEKFVVASDGKVAARFGPRTDPHDPALREAIEAVLPA
ncbi:MULTISPECIES: glutathione peroxidase [unclassified Frankia]|uniref:glutathione peroxidase n=1 Tax=unclassified Frankia TaxID=2632575 RepID=UPI002024E86E